MKIKAEFARIAPIQLSSAFATPELLQTLGAFPGEDIGLEEFSSMIKGRQNELCPFFFALAQTLFSETISFHSKVSRNSLRVLMQLQSLKGFKTHGVPNIDDTFRYSAEQPARARQTIRNCFREGFEGGTVEMSAVFGDKQTSSLTQQKVLEVDASNFKDFTNISGKTLVIDCEFPRILFRDCLSCQFFFREKTAIVHIKDCSQCEFFFAKTEITFVEHSSSIRLSTIAHLVMASNLHDSTFNLFSSVRPTLMGEIKAVKLAPYNSNWINFGVLSKARDLFNAQAIDAFSKPFLLYNFQKITAQENSFEILPPNRFEMIALPENFMPLSRNNLSQLQKFFPSIKQVSDIEAEESLKTELPLLTPPEYISSELKKWKALKELKKLLKVKKLLAKDIFSATQKIKTRFKEWVIEEKHSYPHYFNLVNSII